MNIKNHLKGKKAIFLTGLEVQTPYSEVHKDIQTTIDAAWESTDPQVKLMQAKLFPNGKPTPEEFIAVMSKQIKNTR